MKQNKCGNEEEMKEDRKKSRMTIKKTRMTKNDNREDQV